MISRHCMKAAVRCPASSLTCPSLVSCVSSLSPPPPLSSPRLAALSRPAVSTFAPAVRFFSHSPASRMALTLPRLPLLEAIASHDPHSTVVVHSASGRTFKYGELLGDVLRTRSKLLEATGKSDLTGERIAFLVENSYDYVVTLLAILASKAIAVPMSPAFPAAELQYILNQSEAILLVSSAKFAAKALETLQVKLSSKPAYLKLDKLTGGAAHESVSFDNSEISNAAMMLYTSGTTNRPKGVLIPESALTAQANSLIKAWRYTSKDYLLHVLPLHHIHGTVNAVIAPLVAGSAIEFMFPFNADAVWKRFIEPFTSTSSQPVKEKITFFTAVPTVYSRLMTTFKGLPENIQETARSAVSPENLRVCFSGSAALPTPIKQAWSDLSHGNVLLERYGMTEVGMALSCSLAIADRVDGSVGWPLPSVEARLCELDTNQIIAEGEELDATGNERSGEIQLRGPTIFKEYWKNPEATAKEFVDGEDGRGRWFKTGDVAVRRSVPTAGLSGDPWARGLMYFIQGRKSADIIKTGGEKVSALEVEREMLSLPQVAECAVVAVPSGKWGHKVGAVVVLNGDVTTKWSPMDMRRALRDRLANYKIPQTMKIVDSIPRNAMGKINKKNLVKAVFSEEFSGDEL